VARLDGTLAAEGHGRWRLPEARRLLGVTDERLCEQARRGDVVASGARVADHWEWRLSPADGTLPSAATSPPTE
jgi:hypothetical protein